MAKPKLISPITKQGIQKMRVAAYCRVSTSSADQLNSYARQIEAYTKLIKSNPEWELVEVFADEGISGMKAANRPEFQRMIRMCELRKIDLVLTKSVSRFARNAQESLEYARKLKHIGVGVQFEKESINTLALADEMLLNTFTAIAQEESKAISQNQRLSIVKRMELGEYVDSNAPYGYRLVNKKLQVYEPEAQIVRMIFEMYLKGMSTQEIAKELTKQGIPTKNGKEKWKSTKVSYMLSNEKYIGDSQYQKTFRDTTVPFKQSKNRGEEDMFYATDTHTAIIDKDTFEKVQALLSKRKSQFGKATTLNIYPLTSRIRCTECGSFYRRKVKSGGIKWVCATHEEDAKKCDSFYYSEERIYDGFLAIVNKLRFGQENILGQIASKLEMATILYKRNNKAASQISESIAEINGKILMLDQLRSKGYLASDIHQSQVNDLRRQLKSLRDERQSEFESRILEMLEKVRKLQGIIDEIEEPLDEFNEHLFQEIVLEIEITNRDQMTVTFLGGLKFTELI